MSRKKLGRVADTLFVVATAAIVAQCGPPRGFVVVPGEMLPHAWVYAGTTAPWKRVAAGGGYVTVDVTVRPGATPTWNTPPVTPDTIAEFSNLGEGGKNEKRYALKPQPAYSYKLVLSNDGSARTKWTLLEQTGGSLTAVRSGHLWRCHDYSPLPGPRGVGFFDCHRAVTYDSLETALIARPRSFLVSYFMPATAVVPEDAAVWISCTSGCCSLGA